MGYVVPVAVAAAAFQASIYDVPGGYRAVMFDRFSGVKDKVRSNLMALGALLDPNCHLKATPEGTHFLVPWLQKAILYDCRIKPRVSELSVTALVVILKPKIEHYHHHWFKRFADDLHYIACHVTAGC